MADLVTVYAANPGYVALWDRNPAHPGGEAFVSDATPVQVALTAAVQDGIRVGRLVEVKPEPASQPEPAEVKPQRKKA